jgi:hypothetical protein
MAQQAQQPDFAALARNSNALIQAVGNITQQLTNLQNLPAINLATFNNLRNNHQRTQAQILRLQQQVQNNQNNQQNSQQQLRVQLRRMQNSINNMNVNVQAQYVLFNYLSSFTTTYIF